MGRQRRRSPRRFPSWRRCRRSSFYAWPAARIVPRASCRAFSGLLASVCWSCSCALSGGCFATEVFPTDALPPRCVALPPRLHLRQVGRWGCWGGDGCLAVGWLLCHWGRVSGWVGRRGCWSGDGCLAVGWFALPLRTPPAGLVVEAEEVGTDAWPSVVLFVAAPNTAGYLGVELSFLILA